ncbi:MAG: hypothetical protein PHW61_02330 [Eubacteriales bacterium]|nr:hypothetical protein [Eubacteriales bacterium]
MPELTTPAILSPAHRVKWEKENTMAEYLNTVSIPVIVTIVYCAIDLIKTTIAPYQSLSERLSHFYPLLAVALGIITAAIMFYAVPESISTTNLLVALAIGAASGLTAVGTNQVVKQLAKVGSDSTTEQTTGGSDTGSTTDGK